MISFPTLTGQMLDIIAIKTVSRDELYSELAQEG